MMQHGEIQTGRTEDQDTDNERWRVLFSSAIFLAMKAAAEGGDETSGHHGQHSTLRRLRDYRLHRALHPHRVVRVQPGGKLKEATGDDIAQRKRTAGE